MIHYTIGEMAELLGVATSTLRYYDKEGLLPFVERTAGGIRRFKESDLEWLVTIEHLKKTGMSIRDIRIFIDWCMEGDGTIACRLDLIDRQRAAVQQQIAQLQDTLKILDYKHWYYQTALEAGTCNFEVMSAAIEDMPAELCEGREKICVESACAALEHARAVCVPPELEEGRELSCCRSACEALEHARTEKKSRKKEAASGTM